MSKGTILLPKKFTKEIYISDRYHVFLNTLAAKLNWDIVVGDDISQNQIQGNILLALKCPQHDGIHRGANIPNISSDIKVITYTVDIQCYRDGSIFHKALTKVLDRSDLIICPYDEAFRTKMHAYVDKYEWFPHYFSTTRYSSLSFDNIRINKCVLAGALSDIYQVRLEAAKSAQCQVIPHPGYDPSITIANIDRTKYKIGDDFAKELNAYCCAVTCTSSFKYVLAKHFEIAAAKTILLTDRCVDLDKIGFVPDVHYIEVTSDNVRSKIYEVVNNTNKYKEIAVNAYNLVIQTSTINHRVEQLINILRDRKWL